jgi:pimeloyl-ACP methyl ester carboxylesterase
MGTGLHVHLAHGASGSAASMRPWTDGLAARGHPATPVQLPKGPAERAIPAYREAVIPGPGVVIGGQSFGGRVASLLAADEPPAGLVLLCYPLHRPGHPETVLLLSGEADPFARIELLRDAVPRLPDAELVTFPGIGHGLDRVRDDALDRISAWLARLGRPA